MLIFRNDRVIITFPAYVRNVHHTKTIYKIIERPVYVDASQLFGQADIPQSSSEVVEVTNPVGDVYSDKQPGKSSNHTPGDHGNGTMAPESAGSSVYFTANNSSAVGHGDRSRYTNGYYNAVTSRYHDHGIESKDTYEPEGFLNGQSEAVRGSGGREGNGRGRDLGRDDEHWHQEPPGVQRIHRDGPNLHASVSHRGYRKPNHPVHAYHGHVADDVVWHVVGDRKPAEHINGLHKPKYVHSPKHGHFVKVWHGQEISVPTLRKYNDFNAFLREPNERDKLDSRGGHDSNNNKNVIAVGNAVTRGPQSGYNNVFPVGHSDRGTAGYQNKFESSVYGPRGTGGVGYLQTKENSWPDTLNGMSSISTATDLPQIFKNVYFTLDPVVPYNDVMQPPK